MIWRVGGAVRDGWNKLTLGAGPKAAGSWLRRRLGKVGAGRSGAELRPSLAGSIPAPDPYPKRTGTWTGHRRRETRSDPDKTP